MVVVASEPVEIPVHVNNVMCSIPCLCLFITVLLMTDSLWQLSSDVGVICSL